MHRVDVSLHELFQALSDPYRIRIIRLMIESKSELCLCELSEALQAPEYKLSRHIKVLKSSGLIASEREGKWIYHSLVKNENYLKFLYKTVTLFPDSESQLARDLSRFEMRLKMRESGRCRQLSLIAEENLKARK